MAASVESVFVTRNLIKDIDLTTEVMCHSIAVYPRLEYVVNIDGTIVEFANLRNKEKEMIPNQNTHLATSWHRQMLPSQSNRGSAAGLRVAP